MANTRGLNKCPFPPRKGRARSTGRTRKGRRKDWERRECQESQGGTSGTGSRCSVGAGSRWGPRSGGASEGGGPSPGAQPTPQLPLPEPGQGRTVLGLAQPGGRKGGHPALVCCVGGRGARGSGPPALSPSLQLSLRLPISLAVSASLVLPSYCLSHLGVCGPSRSMPLSLWLSPPSLRRSLGLFLAVSGREDPPPRNSSPCLVPVPHPPGIRAGTLSSEAEE